MEDLSGKDMGIDKEKLAERSALFTQFVIEARISGTNTIENLLDFTNKTFTYEDLRFYAIAMLMEKTEFILAEVYNNGGESEKLLAIKAGYKPNNKN